MSFEYNMSLIKIMLCRETHLKYRSCIKIDVLGEIQSELLQCVDKYLDTFTDVDNIALPELSEWFFHCYKDTLDDTARALYLEAFKSIEQTNTAKEIDVIEHFQKQLLSQKLKDATTDKVNVEAIEDALTQFREQQATVSKKDYLDMNIDEIYSQIDRTTGYKFRLKWLNANLGSLMVGDFVLVTAAVNTGKCLGKDTPVLLYDGRVLPVQEIKVGDLLMGDDSTPRKVLSLARGTEQLYKVKQKNGEDYVVNESHILSLKYCNSTKRHKKFEPYQTYDIPLVDYINMPRNDLKGYKVAVEFKHRPVIVDPYFVGLWLGDGSTSQPCICSASPEVVSWLEAYAINRGLTLSTYEQVDNKSSLYYLKDLGRKDNRLINELKELGIYDNKRIPHAYLTNSQSVRKAVLAGLLDTDGYMDPLSGSIEIVQVREDLANDIVYLARSLGFYVTKSIKVVNNINYYRLYIAGDINSLPLLRIPKFTRKTEYKRKGLHTAIELEKLDVGEYYGFTIDGNHRFLLGDFTVTHNTKFIVSEMTHIAQQITNGHVAYFNNEEFNQRCGSYLFSSTLNRVPSIIDANRELSLKKYEEAMNGDRERIRVYDCDGKPFSWVEKKIKMTKPKLVVIDLMNKLAKSKGERHDLVVTSVAEKLRRIAKEICPVIAVMQADSTAMKYDGESGEKKAIKYLSWSQISESKTGVPGAADIIIGIGRDDEKPMSRYMSICKSKFCQETRKEVQFYGDKCLYID